MGAGGILAAEFVAQQSADGYTLMLGAFTHVTQKLLQPGAKFDPAAAYPNHSRRRQPGGAGG
ncbi:hypothetical protein [Cupriavidus necator]|uniref:hypothetical protein n=1 Tax=Cupriavidus necator TaxID=106590 RepID=UPI0039C3A811